MSKYIIICDECGHRWVKTSCNTWICAKCGTNHARKIVEPEINEIDHIAKKREVYLQQTNTLLSIERLKKEIGQLENEYTRLEIEDKRLCKIDVQIYKQKLKKKENSDVAR